MASLFPAGAPALADAVAVVEIVLAVMLLAGAFVVRSGRVRVHRYLQSAIILINIPIVLYWMVPEYLTYVAPRLIDHFARPEFFIPTVMLVAGSIAELLGIYIILVAGTTWLPERFRFRRYKLWMRTELVLWWCVVLAGLTTYWLLFVPGASL